MDESIDEGWITNAEMAAWLKLVEKDILDLVLKAENSKPTALPEPSDPPGHPRLMTVAIALALVALLYWWSAFH